MAKSSSIATAFGLNRELANFTLEAQINQITPKIKHLNNSEGKAIDEINKCIVSYEKYCEEINELFSATEYYLYNAIKNLDNCDDEMAEQARGLNKG